MKWKLTVKVDQKMIQEEVDSLSKLQRELHGKIQCIKAETQLDLDKNEFYSSMAIRHGHITKRCRFVTNRKVLITFLHFF